MIGLSVSVLYFNLRSQYEHQFVICAIFKNEAPYLKEWIDYHHLVLNASKFYLYNNDSSDDYQNVLAPYIEKNLVELIQWESTGEHALGGWLPEGAPWNDYQIGAYNHCIKNKALGKARWVAMIDIDEFIVPTNGLEEFYSILSKRDRPWPLSSIGSLEVHWKVFGTSNIWDLNPGDLLIEKLYKCSSKDHGWNRRQVKSIYRPEAVDICLIHKIGKMHKGYKKRTLSPTDFNINHYWFGTEKKLMVKRGLSLEKARQCAEQFNCVEDYTIFQYLDKLKSTPPSLSITELTE
ncbi:MAG: glycosyltransferase family 92 protein [Simkaniaceae bacterium]|nr:glycosyltransferase family 92 protein [Simkaniaceae bacterium]